MKLIKGMSYRGWQKRNTDHFSSLTKEEKQAARKQGYCNVSWDKVQSSWRIISKLAQKIASLFEYKLYKGDIIGAVGLSIIEAEQVKDLAQQAVKCFDRTQQSFDKLVDKTLASYPLL